jgi:hypothetical protein
MESKEREKEGMSWEFSFGQMRFFLLLYSSVRLVLLIGGQINDEPAESEESILRIAK